jgi:hypothetical protein
MLHTDRSAKRPSRVIGLCVALGVFPHAKGSGASSRRRALVVLVSACACVGVLLCMSASALAAAPLISEESVLEASAEGATLRAAVNPEGAGTTYRFEYDTSPYVGAAKHGTSTPSPEGTVEGSSPVTVEAQIQGLSAATAYHYRLVATNASLETSYGEDQTFTTEQTGTEFSLLDNRAWEMVTPTNKHGALVSPLTVEGGVIQAAEDGSAITYVADGPLNSSPEGNPSILESQYVTERVAGGWETKDITTPREKAVEIAPVGQLTEWTAFSPDLETGLIAPTTGYRSPLAADVSENTDYLRENLREAGAPTYTPLVYDGNVPPETHYGGSSGRGLQFAGANSNLEHVVIKSEVPLSKSGGTGAFGNYDQLYEWNAGESELEPVSILPNGEWASIPELGAGNGSDPGLNGRDAVSGNGQRVVWGTGGSSSLYMSDPAEGPSVRLDKVNQNENVAAPEEVEQHVYFQDATADDSRVYFTSTEKLTLDSKAERYKETGSGEDAPELYEYDSTRPKGERLSDLSAVGLEGAKSSGVFGLLGASENGEWLYFVANGKLKVGATEGDCKINSVTEAHEGMCNLYAAHIVDGEETVSLVAVLSAEDFPDWGPAGGGETGEEALLKMTSRVSPNGEYLAFMSDRSLTGYDNHDAVSGAADEEVFLYDAETQRLVCASCDPTGARPHGVYEGSVTESSSEGLGLLVDRHGVWEYRWLAGSVPGWTNYSEGSARYQSRYLSNDGRLFFNSADGLVSQDVNRKEDVYEYEPGGVGSCGSGSGSAGVVFKPGATFELEKGTSQEHAVTEGAGCVGLISGGTAPAESAFLDASARGPGGGEAEDVFFLTSAPLVSQDIDTAYDIYDAHVCSGAVPCGSASTVSPPCTTADSCRAAPASQTAIFGSPGSATFSGAGNVSPAPAVVKGKAKPLTRAQKLAAALRACKKQQRSRRARCEASADRKYGAIKNKAKKSRNHRRASR